VESGWLANRSDMRTSYKGVRGLRKREE
jgi:hypothetical protein